MSGGNLSAHWIMPHCRITACTNLGQHQNTRAKCHFSEGENIVMSTDRELQAKLLKEIYQLDVRRRKLENDMRILDTVNKSLQETAALREIEAFKRRLLLAKFSSH